MDRFKIFWLYCHLYIHCTQIQHIKYFVCILLRYRKIVDHLRAMFIWLILETRFWKILYFIHYFEIRWLKMVWNQSTFISEWMWPKNSSLLNNIVDLYFWNNQPTVICTPQGDPRLISIWSQKECVESKLERQTDSHRDIVYTCESCKISIPSPYNSVVIDNFVLLIFNLT